MPALPLQIILLALLAPLCCGASVPTPCPSKVNAVPGGNVATSDRPAVFHFSICPHSLRTSFLLPNERGTLTEYVRGGYQPTHRSASVWPSAKNKAPVSEGLGSNLARPASFLVMQQERSGGGRSILSDEFHNVLLGGNVHDCELNQSHFARPDSTAPSEVESSKVWPSGGAK